MPREGRGGGRRRGDRTGGRGSQRIRGRRGGLRHGGPRRVLRLVHRDPEIGGEPLQPAAVPLPDRAEFPAALTPVQLTEYESGFDRGAHAVEPGDHTCVRRVPDLDIESGDLSERSAVGRGREDDPLDGRLHPREVDEEGVGDQVAGAPLALVPDRARGVRRLVVEDEVAVGAHFPGDQQQRRGVRVGGARTGAPTQFDAQGRRRHRRIRSFRHWHVRPHRESACRARPGGPASSVPSQPIPGAVDLP